MRWQINSHILKKCKKYVIDVKNILEALKNRINTSKVWVQSAHVGRREEGKCQNGIKWWWYRDIVSALHLPKKCDGIDEKGKIEKIFKIQEDLKLEFETTL